MIRRSTKDGFIVLVSLVSYSLLIVFWPHKAGSEPFNAALACAVHVALYILTAYAFSSYCKNPLFLKTPLAISCLLVLVYLGVPFLKYYGTPRFVEFDAELHYRVAALFLICASILIILKLYANKWIRCHLRSQDAMQRSVGPSFVPVMYTVFGTSTFFLITRSMFGDARDVSAAEHNLIVSGYFITLYYLAFFKVQKRAFLNELLFVCGGLAITFSTGQRFAVLLAMLLLIFARLSRVRSHKKRMSMVFLSLMIAPLAVVMTLGPLTEMTKTRYGGVDLIFELQRVDIPDFVASASIADHKESVVAGLYTSSLWALPGGIIDKARLEYSMEPFYRNNGWRSSDYREGYSPFNIDYNDSIFASGAMVGGFLGALLLPLAWYGVFTIIVSQFKSTLLLSLYLGAVPSMFNIEIAFWIIIPTLRNWILTSIMLFGLIQLILALRLLRIRVFRPRQGLLG